MLAAQHYCDQWRIDDVRKTRHGGELAASLRSTVPSLNTCSTPRRSSTTAALTFFPTLPLPYHNVNEIS
jgi:hypothetical protein